MAITFRHRQCGVDRLRRGVREQSCARAYIDTVTFTFEDGRIHTVHKGKGNTRKDASVQDNLGFLTDPWGKAVHSRPVFQQRRRVFAGSRRRPSWTGWLMPTPMRNSPPITTTGLPPTSPATPTRMPAPKGLANAAGDIAQYVAERAEDAFDVIYVPPGIQVQIFVESQIPIDYDTDGRKLHYAYRQRVSHDPLD